jgi:hypothetical protein
LERFQKKKHRNDINYKRLERREIIV